MSYKPEPTYEISFLFRRILVPIDGSENSYRALDFAADIARRYGSKLVVYHVVVKGLREEKDPIEVAKKRLEKYGLMVEYKTIEIDPAESSVAKAIIDELNTGNYDMVVMGARGRSLSAEINLGSTALAVSIHSPVTVVIVR
ncbi:universal stress protein [Desulfurococcaceae archaeon MEX13E-LK6-19]|nr:universal stress protein [Desulfurococcaceae archaeon MEX13E-LK6-19]